MNVSKVEILDAAVADLRQGRAFYDNRQKGIGDYFWDSLIADVESLQLFAGIHQRRGRVYRMSAKHFPYLIHYIIKNETALVVAVLPSKLNPDTITKALLDRT